MRTPSRWELVLEQKPRPVLEHLMAEAARLLAADLGQWPLPVQAFDEQSGGAFAALAAQHPERPDAALYHEAFRLTALDLARDFDAVDEYWRNHRFLEAGLPASARPMILFLTRFVTEQLLALGEATEGRLTRARLLDVLARIERHWALKDPP